MNIDSIRSPIGLKAQNSQTFRSDAIGELVQSPVIVIDTRDKQRQTVTSAELSCYLLTGA